MVLIAKGFDKDMSLIVDALENSNLITTHNKLYNDIWQLLNDEQTRLNNQLKKEQCIYFDHKEKLCLKVGLCVYDYSGKNKVKCDLEKYIKKRCVNFDKVKE